MAFDKAARAEQIARCVSHTGDLLTFPGVTDPFAANIVAAPSDGNPLTRDAGKVREVQVAFARACLGTVKPSSNDYFHDSEGNRYRITKELSHPLQPLAVYLCTVSGPTAS